MFRKAVASDMKMFFDWRNDPVTRKNSISPELIDWDQHSGWFISSLGNPKRVILVYEIGNVAVGSVRLDVFPQYVELSWQLAPEKRGQGVGKKMLCEFVSEFQTRPLQAKIKSENQASLMIATAAGFKRQGVENGIECWKLE